MEPNIVESKNTRLVILALILKKDNDLIPHTDIELGGSKCTYNDNCVNIV